MLCMVVSSSAKPKTPSNVNMILYTYILCISEKKSGSVQFSEISNSAGTRPKLVKTGLAALQVDWTTGHNWFSAKTAYVIFFKVIFY